MCMKPATTVIQYVPGNFEDNTLACDEHVAALRVSDADRTFPVEQVRADVPCCHIGAKS